MCHEYEYAYQFQYNIHTPDIRRDVFWLTITYPIEKRQQFFIFCTQIVSPLMSLWVNKGDPYKCHILRGTTTTKPIVMKT